MKMKITVRFEVEKFNGDHIYNYLVSNGNYGLLNPEILEHSDLGWLLENELLGLFENGRFVRKDVLKELDNYTEFVYIEYELFTGIDDVDTDGFYLRVEPVQKGVRYE